jgi:hypothetical protein
METPRFLEYTNLRGSCFPGDEVGLPADERERAHTDFVFSLEPRKRKPESESSKEQKIKNE